mmetsp:Transcript_15779/g.23261  ORF Transcript_15779/g.23261 Transcript_15779/m.23261 type:complete len:312 (-) Transcript_15779:1974-2909(-)
MKSIAVLLLVAVVSNAFVLQTPRRLTTVSTSSSKVVQQSKAFVRPTTLSSPSRSRSTRLWMGWGPDPIWSSAKVSSNEVACGSGSCVSVKLEVPESAVEEYKIPGQYVQVRLNEEMEKPLFLAIASPPTGAEGPQSFEFLIKKTEGNEWLTGIAGGAEVEMSQVLGGGFPVEENLYSYKYDFPTQNIMLFAVGSGIAPIKAAMESGEFLQVDGTGRTARLYYGVQTPQDLCFVDKFDEWEQAGFEVVPVLSQPPPEWTGRSGYVQNALEEDGVPVPRNSGALMCGMKGMTESVKSILEAAGVFEGRVMTNF